MFLRTPARIGILTGLFVAVILLASTALLQQRSVQIRILQQELAGNELLQYLQQVRRNLGEYRLAHLDSKPGSQDDELDQLSLATSELKSRLDRSPDIQSLSASSSPVFNSLDKLLRVRDQKEQDRRPELKQMSRHIQQLANSIGDASNLILDSQLESYYVMSYLLTISPKEQEYLVEITANLPDPGGRSQALFNIDQLRSLIRDHQRSLSALQVQTKNSKLRTYLDRSSIRYQELQDFTNQAEAALNARSGDVAVLVPKSQQMLKDAYRSWNDGSIRLGELLVQRLNFEKKEYSSQAWLLFSSTIMLIFLTGVVCFRLQAGIREARAALVEFQGTLPAQQQAARSIDELDEIASQIRWTHIATESKIAVLESERDAAQERTRLAEAEAIQTSAALDLAPVPVIILHSSLKIIYLNERAEAAFPENTIDVTGRLISSLQPHIPWANLVGKTAHLNSIPWEAGAWNADISSRALPDGNTLFVLHLHPVMAEVQTSRSAAISPEANTSSVALELLSSIAQKQMQAVFVGLLSLDNTLDIRRSMGDDAYAQGLESIAEDLRQACPDIHCCCIHATGELLFAGLVTAATPGQLQKVKQKIKTSLMYRRQPMYLDISMGYSMDGALEEARMNLIQDQAKRFAGLDRARAA